MWSFGAFCDTFHISSRLFLKMSLDPSRESLLHFFEQIRRSHPTLTRLRRRDRRGGALTLDEEESGEGERRFVRLNATSLKFGHTNASSLEVVEKFAATILTQAPPQLSLSELDYDYFEVAIGFDLEYRGNHDEIVAEALFPNSPLMAALGGGPMMRVIDCQPFAGVTLTDDCELQAYLEVKPRTSTFEVRSGEFENVPLTVQLTVRQYWNPVRGKPLVAAHQAVLRAALQQSEHQVVPLVVQPLAAAIASRR